MFKRVFVTLTALFSLTVLAPAALAANSHVLLSTTAGNIEIELDSQKAPVSVKNFLDYVNSGYYNNTIFHRVIPGFMVQGGGFTADMQQKTTNAPIKTKRITVCVTCAAPSLWRVLLKRQRNQPVLH